MAAKKAGREIANLTPNSTLVEVGELQVRVAGDANENRILNYITAGTIRAIVEKNLKLYAERDDPLTPKELRDVAEAGRALAEFSAAVYQGGEPVQKEKSIDVVVEEAPDFTKLNKKDGTQELQADSSIDSGGKVD